MIQNQVGLLSGKVRAVPHVRRHRRIVLRVSSATCACARFDTPLAPGQVSIQGKEGKDMMILMHHCKTKQGVTHYLMQLCSRT